MLWNWQTWKRYNQVDKREIRGENRTGQKLKNLSGNSETWKLHGICHDLWTNNSEIRMSWCPVFKCWMDNASIFGCITNEITRNWRTGGKGDVGWREEGERNYRHCKSNWLKDYIWTDDVDPTYSAEKFRLHFGNPENLYKKLKNNLLDSWHEYLQFSQDVVKMYGETYLTCWQTGEELDDVERCYERKGFPDCVGQIDRFILFGRFVHHRTKGSTSKDSTLTRNTQSLRRSNARNGATRTRIWGNGMLASREQIITSTYSCSRGY